ncbi:unnamed protein product [Caenorhabditis auriculariae]|uniref:Myeloid leukemia factor n=1 Tax=Caenorhabditis auriculariae TaxID=2777116 RepID=A0A8S1HTL8_9PELO|nr:unnamed protein product [Caenorhabditis auriculariae]
MNQMHRQMMEDMDMMMGGMIGGNPFGGLMGGMGRSPFSAITDGSGMIPTPRHQQVARDPFGGFGGIFCAMNQLSQNAMSDPNTMVFSQSTMMTFGPDGKPHLVEKSVRKTGDVRETRRKELRGDESSMSIGHSIGDRSHVIEKKRDKDGNVRKQQKFVNLDEASAEDFDREFTSRVRSNLGGSSSRNHSGQRYLESGGSRPSGSRNRSAATSSSHAPIITLPEEDDEDETKRSRRGGNQIEGPVIREISEEEAEQSIPKRRRGPLGAFFAE